MRLLILILLFLISNAIFSQLNGTYTVGGSNPDFPNFVSVIDSLNTVNTSDTVNILIRPGTYVGNVQYNGGANSFGTNHPINFQSETGLNDVLITSSLNITIELYWNSTPLKKITFKHINFETTANSNFSYSVKLVNMNTEFDSCNFYGGLYLYHWFINGSTFIVKNCTVQSPNKIEFRSGGTVENNVFLSDGFEQTTGAGYLYYHRNFQQGRLNVGYGEIYDNEIGEIWMSHSADAMIVNNKINGNISLSYLTNITLMSNRILGYTRLTFDEYTKLINNHFHNYLDITYGVFHTILNNNFGPQAYLDFPSNGGLISNNLFSLGIYGNINNSNLTISNNNYYLLDNNPNGYNIYGGQVDDNPFIFDPLYVDTSNLVPTNPDLIGLGIQNPLVIYDIDNLLRPTNSTLGANEICYSSQSVDTIHMTCGDSIPLSICNLDPNNTYNWAPTIGLNDSTSSRPYASPTINTTYVISDSLNIPLDSVTIIIKSFNPAAEKDTSILCGDSLKLISSYHPLATYLWTPNNDLTAPFSRVTYAKPSVSTDYIININISGCGSHYDTVSVIVDTLPNAKWYTININNYDVTFQNFSTCYDSVFWNFGDGDTSSLEYTIHTYDTNGIYQVCLIAFNSYGSDTLCGNVWISNPVGLEGNKVIENKIKVYPNPAKDFINFEFNKVPLELIVFDSQGKVILNKMMLENSFKLEVNHLQSGIYFYNGIYEDKRNTGKFIIK